MTESQATMGRGPDPRPGRGQRRFEVMIGPRVMHRELQGIADFARQADWVLLLEAWQTREIPTRWRGDGLIGHFGYHPEALQAAREAGAPIVNLGDAPADLTVPSVESDHGAIAGLAAAHFIEHGYRDIALAVPGPGCFIAERLMAGLRAALAGEPGRKLHMVDLSRTPLTTLPVPVAVLGAGDAVALDIERRCMDLELSVPDQVAVLGIGNDQVFCELGLTALSSVDPDPRRMGHEAARLLDGLMRGRTPPGTPVLIPPAGVVARRSTECLAVPHREAAAAVRYVWENYRKPITVEQVAAHVGISRRRLQDLLARHIGRTLKAEIDRLRVQDAADMLIATDKKTVHVAQECGFHNGLGMSRAFLRILRCTPRQWRQRHAPGAL